MSRCREKNNNWRGGRVIASNGYILIRVGVGHHLADVRGYAYEHRLVAEQVIGRRLLPGEVIHHKDGRKSNNAPSNIEIMPSTAHHFVHHRRTDIPRRLPNEPNEQRICECGCGATFPMYDAGGRPRRYVSGHNPFEAPRSDEILSILSSGALQRREIARLIGASLHVTAVTLSRLRRQGKVEIVRRGIWGLK